MTAIMLSWDNPVQATDLIATRAKHMLPKRKVQKEGRLHASVGIPPRMMEKKPDLNSIKQACCRRQSFSLPFCHRASCNLYRRAWDAACVDVRACAAVLFCRLTRRRCGRIISRTRTTSL